MTDLKKPRLTKKYGSCFGLVKVKDDEQEVESPYPNTLKAILECFNRLGELENAIESGELVQVVHGRWDKHVSDDSPNFKTCSNCGMPSDFWSVKKYCEECGAKMEVEP